MKKVIFIIMVSFLLSGCNRLDEHQPFTDGALTLPSGDAVSQVITASRNNLNTVSICLRNPSRVEIPMTFTLIENNQAIRTLDFNSANIDKDDCTKLKFLPVDNSQGHSYIAKVESAKQEKESTISQSIFVEKSGSTLHYKTFYYQSMSDVVTESFSQFYRRLFLDPWFMIIWVGLIIFTIFKIVRSKSAF